ncbi:hypothetical protein LJR225_004571 [Phenylobacterium sp. LjRoot225]|uniref:hypothetical protein n=1 Tax=Phenylobacterium sp. LjRoot225 TaxID=3342285 RepID=UPI003ECEE056
MIRILAGLLAVFLGVTALAQLIAPLSWYDAVPGVVATGPFNAHFVRDIGAAYLTVAGSLAAFAWRPRLARPALMASATFLVVHAGIHLFDAVCGAQPLSDTVRDFAGVHLMALITLGLALAPEPRSRPQPSLKGAV